MKVTKPQNVKLFVDADDVDDNGRILLENSSRLNSYI